MYCPECGVEYRDGFAASSDCQVALVPEAPGNSQEALIDWVPVFESNDHFAISLAKGSLEDSAIPYWMQGDETAARLALGPIMFPSCQFLVPKDREQEARDLLSQLESPPGTEAGS